MNDIVDNQYLELRDAIIQQAVWDYLSITAGKYKQTHDCNISEITLFFKNDCYGLLVDLEGISGMDILAKVKYNRKRRKNQSWYTKESGK